MAKKEIDRLPIIASNYPLYPEDEELGITMEQRKHGGEKTVVKDYRYLNEEEKAELRRQIADFQRGLGVGRRWRRRFLGIKEE